MNYFISSEGHFSIQNNAERGTKKEEQNSPDIGNQSPSRTKRKSTKRNKIEAASNESPKVSGVMSQHSIVRVNSLYKLLQGIGG